VVSSVGDAGFDAPFRALLRGVDDASRVEERARFALTRRFSWAIESLSPDRAGLTPLLIAGSSGFEGFERPEPEREELEEREIREVREVGEVGEEADELELRLGLEARAEGFDARVEGFDALDALDALDD